MKNPRFMAGIAVEEGARICDKLTKKPSKTNHPVISVFYFGRLGLSTREPNVAQLLARGTFSTNIARIATL